MSFDDAVDFWELAAKRAAPEEYVAGLVCILESWEGDVKFSRPIMLTKAWTKPNGEQGIEFRELSKAEASEHAPIEHVIIVGAKV